MQAQSNLATAEAGLASASRAVEEAEKKYDKVRNKCISGRRKRSVNLGDIILQRCPTFRSCSSALSRLKRKEVTVQEQAWVAEEAGPGHRQAF